MRRVETAWQMPKPSLYTNKALRNVYLEIRNGTYLTRGDNNNTATYDFYQHYAERRKNPCPRISSPLARPVSSFDIIETRSEPSVDFASLGTIVEDSEYDLEDDSNVLLRRENVAESDVYRLPQILYSAPNVHHTHRRIRKNKSYENVNSFIDIHSRQSQNQSRTRLPCFVVPKSTDFDHCHLNKIN